MARNAWLSRWRSAELSFFDARGRIQPQSLHAANAALDQRDDAGLLEDQLARNLDASSSRTEL
ncbi:hypothetical protein CWO91_18025 [Bradyrhizobium genosp. SA-3]|nr:hypothetical protein CWO91_18025 [Bradyrhizobium genosp. SA-3]